MVRLKAFSERVSSLLKRHFNSTMVRLKAARVLRGIDMVRFQFHNGTIKSAAHRGEHNEHPGFQFHNGTIKRERMASDPAPEALFQFHNGTIKRCCLSVCIANIFISIPQWYD